MTALQYHLLTRTEGFRTRVLLNRWPVYRNSDMYWCSVGTKLGPWLVSGENELEVQLVLPNTERDKEDENWNATDVGQDFRISLYEPAPPMDEPDPDLQQPLFVYQWTDDEAPLNPEGPTRVCRHRFQAPAAFRGWQWEKARAYCEADQSDVIAMVEHFYAALQGGEVPALLQMLKMRTHEMATVGEVAEDHLALEQGMCFYMIARGDGWKLRPLKKDELLVEPHADGRLVEVTARDGVTPIVSTSDSMDFGFDLILSHLDGQWTFVR